MKDRPEFDIAGFEARHSAARYAAATQALAVAAPPATTPDSAIATDKGMVQYHVIAETPTSSQYAAMMQENANNLMGMGGLIHGYMTANYPTVDSQLLDINLWNTVVGHLPDVAVGPTVTKRYSNTVAGTDLAGTFLQMLAKAKVAPGAKIGTDFGTWLEAMGQLVFAAHGAGQTYKAITCSYLCYLVDNGAGGFYDYGAIVLREVDITQDFMTYKGACQSSLGIQVEVQFTEITSPVQLSRIRKGGPDFQLFQQLVNANATAAFSKAANFFDGRNTPQADLTPYV